MGLCAAVVGVLTSSQHLGLPLSVGIGLTLSLGAGVGLLNGLRLFRLSPWACSRPFAALLSLLWVGNG
ncbi:hypothetical protein ACFL1X_07225 [Candidatus Hydrogenedentota bacterium]